MIQLNQEQTQCVADYLQATPVRQSLRDDLLDQLCCEIEAEMDQGSPFKTAYELVVNNWQTEKIRSIDRSITFTTKTKPMMTKILAFAAIVSGILLLSPQVQEEESSTSQPSVATEMADTPVVAVDYLDFDPPTASPLKGVALEDAHSTFGMRMHPLKKKKMLHTGIDFKADVGTPVYATAVGTVISAGDDGPHGIRVIIRHADGYSTAYSHLSAADVKTGQEVQLGEQIGKVGTTGMSTGPHLHYEVRKEDKPINPLAQL